jgi:hypothetical protein
MFPYTDTLGRRLVAQTPHECDNDAYIAHVTYLTIKSHSLKEMKTKISLTVKSGPVANQNTFSNHLDRAETFVSCV